MYIFDFFFFLWVILKFQDEVQLECGIANELRESFWIDIGYCQYNADKNTEYSPSQQPISVLIEEIESYSKG